MLPTVTPATPKLGVPGVSMPCTRNPQLHENRATRYAAARVCAACPIVNQCLLQGMREDAAYRLGHVRWAPLGVRGGVWFQPGSTPRRLESTRRDAPSRTRAEVRAK